VRFLKHQLPAFGYGNAALHAMKQFCAELAFEWRHCRRYLWRGQSEASAARVTCSRSATVRSLRGKRGTNPQQMPGVIRRWSPPLKQVRPTLDTLRLEIAMSRIMLICALAALLAAGSTQSASAVESANQTAWAQARLACADVGIAPGSGAFGQCVADLYYSLWDEENESER